MTQKTVCEKRVKDGKGYKIDYKLLSETGRSGDWNFVAIKVWYDTNVLFSRRFRESDKSVKEAINHYRNVMVKEMKQRTESKLENHREKVERQNEFEEAVTAGNETLFEAAEALKDANETLDSL